MAKSELRNKSECSTPQCQKKIGFRPAARRFEGQCDPDDWGNWDFVLWICFETADFVLRVSCAKHPTIRLGHVKCAMNTTIQNILFAAALPGVLLLACVAHAGSPLPGASRPANGWHGPAVEPNQRSQSAIVPYGGSVLTTAANDETAAASRTNEANDDSLSALRPPQRRSRKGFFSAPPTGLDGMNQVEAAAFVRDFQLVSFSRPGITTPVVSAALQQTDLPRPLSEGNRNTDPGSQGGVGDGQTLGEAPPETNAPIQFLRQVSVLLEPGEFQFELRVQYLNDDVDFVSAQIRGNNLIIAEARRRQRLLTVPIEFRLGITSDVQAFVNVPFGWSNSELAIAGRDDFTNIGGIGDVSAGLTKLLLEGTATFPQVLGSLSFSAPSGRTSLATSVTTPGGSLGEGFWSLTAGLTFIHTYDPVVVFYGFGYRHRFERTIDGFFITPGEQAFYRFGLGFAVNPKVTLSASFFGSFIGENEVNNVGVGGSIQEPMHLRFAATIVRDKSLKRRSTVRTIEPFVILGLTEDAVDTLIGISRTY